ncbi:hypothetical protein AB6A40_002722 [Gnathostoma spinigerum]|uniref:Uncharacterized protein n=1 Tax=Gnathostoma spinigerum TaxID=75299 RepID=A0ABD6E7E3_9BILA
MTTCGDADEEISASEARHEGNHDECIELLLPQGTINKIVLSSTQSELTDKVKTTHQPVVLEQDPSELLCDETVAAGALPVHLQKTSTNQ